MEAQLATSDMAPSHDDMKRIIAEKARELFIVCDKEEKGFVCRRDMQRLDGELPLSPEQLEEVFDSLDDDGNGFLTLEEFTEGFGGFLGLNLDPDIETEDDKEEKEIFEDSKLDDGTLEADFHRVMETLGASGTFDEQEHVKDLWKSLRKNEPELLGNFEDFIQKVCVDMHKAQLTMGELENALKTRGSAHELEVRRLYEEMELQIRAERERILHEEKEKEKRVREELTFRMRNKDEQLQELSKRQIDLEGKLKALSDMEEDIKQENEMLQKTNYELRTKLDGSLMDLDESKTYLKDIQVSMKKEKRDRAHAALKVTENIMEERESLVKQLNLLRTMNKKLQDEKDEFESRLKAKEAERAEVQKQTAPLVKQGSVMAPYVAPARPRRHGQSGVDGEGDDDDSYIINEEEEVEVDDEIYVNGHGTPIHGVINGGMLDDEGGERMDLVMGHKWTNGRIGGGVDEMDGEVVKRSAQQVYSSASPETKLGSADSTDSGVGGVCKPSSLREEPVGCHSANEALSEAAKIAALPKGPERLFKVVFVGDSGVGKTSFIHRFCHDAFRPSFSATIGVDFQVKTLVINDSLIALQLWDTAGQERFRSITRHYFRKADGVIIMYDVNSETSFINVRNWMNSVIESTSESVVRMMIGNKTDMADDSEDSRQIKEEVGKSLAESYGCLFYETSAKSGQNVKEVFNSMATILQEREDQDIEKALNLTDEPQEKGCCGK